MGRQEGGGGGCGQEMARSRRKSSVGTHCHISLTKVCVCVCGRVEGGVDVQCSLVYLMYLRKFLLLRKLQNIFFKFYILREI